MEKEWPFVGVILFCPSFFSQLKTPLFTEIIKKKVELKPHYTQQSENESTPFSLTFLTIDPHLHYFDYLQLLNNPLNSKHSTC